MMRGRQLSLLFALVLIAYSGLTDGLGVAMQTSTPPPTTSPTADSPEGGQSGSARFPWPTFWYVTWGIAASLLIPSLSRLLGEPNRLSLRVGPMLSAIWRVARPYVGIAVVSLVVATIVLASARGARLAWYDAMLLGYAWDSTLQKLKT